MLPSLSIEARTMTPVDIAWVAGLIEGEGCINPARLTNNVVVSVNMTDYDTVYRLAVTTGMGRLQWRPRSREGWKDQLVWNVGKRGDVARLLLAIAPLMSARRSEAIARAASHLANSQRRARRGCGTRNGARWHRQQGETPCFECREAENTERRARRRAKKMANAGG